jgi:uncharacterized protein (DUF779 family)
MLHLLLSQAGGCCRGNCPLTTKCPMVSQITRVAIREVMSLMS